MSVGKKFNYYFTYNKVSSEVRSKPFFLSGVMRMCRIPSGNIIRENIHAALRHNVIRLGLGF